MTSTLRDYVENWNGCFFAGKLVDEGFRLLNIIKLEQPLVPSWYQLVNEIGDLSAMARDHYDQVIKPSLKKPTLRRSSSSESLDSDAPAVPAFTNLLAKISERYRIAKLEEKMRVVMEWKAKLEANEKPDESLDIGIQVAPNPLAKKSDRNRIADLEEKMRVVMEWKARMEAKERPAVVAKPTNAAGRSNSTRKSTKPKPEPKSEDQPPALASATAARPKRSARVMAATRQSDPAPGRVSRTKPAADSTDGGSKVKKTKN